MALRLALIAFFLLLSGKADAALCFGATCGVSDGTDSVQTGYGSAITTTHSFSACYRITAYCATCGTSGTVAGLTGGNGWIVQTRTATSAMEIVEPFSTTKGNWYFPASLNTWHCFAFSYDGSNVANNPIVYEDGALQTLTSVISPIGSFNAGGGAFMIGNGGNSRPLEGRISNVGYWANTILPTNNLISLSLGMSPTKILPQYTFFYRMEGRNLPPIDWGPSHLTSTLTGTLYQPDAQQTSMFPYAWENTQ